MAVPVQAPGDLVETLQWEEEQSVSCNVKTVYKRLQALQQETTRDLLRDRILQMAKDRQETYKMFLSGTGTGEAIYLYSTYNDQIKCMHLTSRGYNRYDNVSNDHVTTM